MTPAKIDKSFYIHEWKKDFWIWVINQNTENSLLFKKDVNYMVKFNTFFNHICIKVL